MQNAAEPQSTTDRRLVRRFLKGLACCTGGCVLLAAAAAAVMMAASPAVYSIPSDAMAPTLSGTGREVHDVVLVTRWEYRFRDPRFGEIVVFRAPKKADAMAASERRAPVENVLVKRVIGLPGDTIEIKEAKNGKSGHEEPVYCVWRNGNLLQEPYLKEPMEPPSAMAVYGVSKPLKLPPGQYFVMGDNRNESNDSQYWGPLERSRIFGKVISIVSPPERARQFP